MAFKKKAQAATEYLMTYGWALLAIVIVAAVLWNMGVFGGKGCGRSITGFAGENIYIEDVIVHATGAVDATVKNSAGKTITIGSTNITAGTTSVVTGVDTITTGTAGQCYTSKTLEITYTIEGGLSHTASGSISGTYQS